MLYISYNIIGKTNIFFRAKIQNCIICNGAQVGENASIVDSQVGANYIVPNKCKYSMIILYE